MPGTFIRCAISPLTRLSQQNQKSDVGQETFFFGISTSEVILEQ